MNIRNVAIIAHVDHGKTTLVDALLKQTQTKLGKDLADSSLIMDSNELEKERGITIFSKNASVIYGDTKINIVDTPGHADFGGEVERVLKLVDGCLLLVDAKEGPMPQTRFVLKQALKMGLKIIVVVNKIDKPDARVGYVINKTFDLFLDLGADEESAYFPVVYASAKNGLAGDEPDLDKLKDIIPIFEAILKYIPSPTGDPEKPLQFLATSISADNFKGRIATGRVINGQIKIGQQVIHINRAGMRKSARLTALMDFEGLDRVDVAGVQAGDIVALAGISDITIGETITDTMETEALPLLSIEEPTVRMTFGVNTSPFGGKEGEFKTARQIQERLLKAAEDDVALKVEESAGKWIVSGRGELHLAILIERMRREGYEFEVSRPRVIEKKVSKRHSGLDPESINSEILKQVQDDAIITLTPYERVFIEVPEAYSGVVMQKMGERHGNLVDMVSNEDVVNFEFTIATKDLFGFRSEFITDTKGLGILNANFLEFAPDNGVAFSRNNGSLVVHENGITKLYSLTGVQDRGVLFLGPGVTVYRGEVIGQNSRPGDISINVCKEKQQTNHRSSGEGVSEHFNIPKVMGLEQALEYIDDTELVEVTPKNIRVRKMNLDGTR